MEFGWIRSIEDFVELLQVAERLAVDGIDSEAGEVADA